MSATTIREKRETTLPAEVCEAAGLSPGDQVDWRIEDGEIRGRKLVPQKSKETFPRGSLLKYLTPERDREQLAILSGCVQGPEPAPAIVVRLARIRGSHAGWR